ncbi:FAD-dependent monooxygenase [uncultured Maribacter sp.]|uniref:FAD-dependent monooxygenase n=1 Tax=uncultured Maribacter sp. TaxID=431308 RepID=UPI002625E09E|nr:FAD-dependent monooxygenase [uncultured Maribacter sp.]
MTIDIIGAGIGGLTTAIALEKKGVKCRIFEQTEIIKPVGAGIILANNAMQVYKKLGLKDTIEAHGTPISTINIVKDNLEVISSMDLSVFEKANNVKNIAIHRGILQQILIDQLKETKVYLNHKLKKIEKNENGHSLYFDNDSVEHSSILIGADGLNSMVRKQLFKNNFIRKANQICWRGVTDYNLPNSYKRELNEAWGNSDRFGFVPLANNKVYWYALKTIPKNNDEYSMLKIEEYFKNYNSLVKDIIICTPKEAIYTAEIEDLKPMRKWHNQNTCLIGDAAHATTPNMGQGACQAIEDAYVLSECLANYNYSDAFLKFQKLRINKAHKVVKASWSLGKLAHISNPILIALRNRIMALTPESINRKQSKEIFQLPELNLK